MRAGSDFAHPRCHQVVAQDTTGDDEDDECWQEQDEGDNRSERQLHRIGIEIHVELDRQGLHHRRTDEYLRPLLAGCSLMLLSLLLSNTVLRTTP